MSRIFVAGHNGMVGRAIFNKLSKETNHKLITVSHSDLDLTNTYEVKKFLKETKPDKIILAAAKVGGINANNKYPADFIYENLMIQCNVINEAFNSGVTKLLQLGSSCIYPKYAPQPIQESCLLTGELEKTHEPYAIAKIAGIKLCESYNRQYGVDYRSIMPSNLYGRGDNFHETNSHVLPALIRRFHNAKISNEKEVIVWGTGKPRREFLHVDDMAEAALFIFNLDKKVYRDNTKLMNSHINVGSGNDISIIDLALLIAKVTGYKGKIIMDNTKPDGTFRKIMDIGCLESLGWQAKISLEEGIADTYEWYTKNLDTVRK